MAEKEVLLSGMKAMEKKSHLPVFSLEELTSGRFFFQL